MVRTGNMAIQYKLRHKLIIEEEMNIQNSTIYGDLYLRPYEMMCKEEKILAY